VLPQSLSELYAVLGPQGRDRVHHRNRQIHFDTAGVQVDLFEFERLIAKDTSEALAQAVKIHRGGLLKDWEEESWFSEERENCLAGYLDAMNTLTRAALVARDFDLAASYLRRSVNAYPEMDSAWTRLVEVYGLMGSAAKVEETQQRYLIALRTRCAEEAREIAPSRRFLLACEQALQSAAAPPVLTSFGTVDPPAQTPISSGQPYPDVSSPSHPLTPLTSSSGAGRRRGPA